jgi:hypothetical protein
MYVNGRRARCPKPDNLLCGHRLLAAPPAVEKGGDALGLFQKPGGYVGAEKFFQFGARYALGFAGVLYERRTLLDFCHGLLPASPERTYTNRRN